MDDKNMEVIEKVFEKMIDQRLEVFWNKTREKNVKEVASEIIEILEPVVAKHIKKHFNEIGKFITMNSEDTEKREEDYAQNS